ncbi:MAG: bifunctional oligoribonuclease/PAP phosphatase NrnA [Spirochaetales bacterium]|nr:bifunctional oligoribonuclease/PAP phosphatase NrnA [Spirochaetales bacterium]
MVKDFIEYINRAEYLVLTSHESPDGDAICSELGLYKLLVSLNKKVIILNSDEAEEKYDFLNTRKYINQINTKNPQLPERFSLIVMDTHPYNIGKAGELLRSNADEVFVIDHHEDSYSDEFIGIHDSTASSTCQLVFQMMEELNFKPDVETSNALFSGIVYDTGSFQYKKTTSETFRIGGNLVENGVDPFTIHNHLDQSNSKAFLVLQMEVMKTLEFHLNDSVTSMTMSKELLKKSGAKYEEGQPLINLPLICKDVEISILFKENESGVKRCSVRSKGNFDCFELANKYNGGGHKTAAGFKISGSFEETKQQVLEEISHFFS